MTKIQIIVLTLWTILVVAGVSYSTFLTRRNALVYEQAMKTLKFDPLAQKQCIEDKKSASLVAHVMLALTFLVLLYPGYNKPIEIIFGGVFLALLVWNSFIINS